MTQELRQQYEQLVQAYNKLPEAWTRRFEKLEGVSEDSIVLKHRTVHCTVELSPLPGIPIKCVPDCCDLEHISYMPIARFQASLYAPLEDIKNPEEGVEALRALQKRETTIHLGLPTFGGERIAFDHYDGGVEYTYDIPQIRLEIPLVFLPEHNLPDLMRSFSFIPYNFNLDIHVERQYHPETDEFRRQMKGYLQGYEEKNPTARIMGSGGGWFNFWAEDEETLQATSKDLEAIAASIQQKSPCRDPFRITSTIKPRSDD